MELNRNRATENVRGQGLPTAACAVSVLKVAMSCRRQTAQAFLVATVLVLAGGLSSPGVAGDMIMVFSHLPEREPKGPPRPGATDERKTPYTPRPGATNELKMRYERVASGGEGLLTRIPEHRGGDQNARYRTWSLFLMCNAHWLGGRTDSELEVFYQRFKSFGDAIGPNNAAVWFFRADVSFATQDWLVRSLDVDRCARLCEKFRLLPSDGPHVLVTTISPNRDDAFNQDAVVVSVRDLDAQHFSLLLGKLADQLLVTRLNQSAIASKAYWLAWEQSVKTALQALGGSVKKVRVVVKQGPVEVEVEGGPAPK